jgi:hypothetical protein
MAEFFRPDLLEIQLLGDGVSESKKETFAAAILVLGKATEK